jgi:predicted nucleotidyltransferase component of viral defense system
MEILTQFQKALLREISKTRLKDTFFLTGGTALAAFYLHHRLSQDLDFFTELPGEVRFVEEVIKKIAQILGAEIQINRSFRTYFECFLKKGEEIIKCDFGQDSPYRLKPIIYQKDYDIYVDNILDIACNKLSALFDRHEDRDFVDIYFLDKEAIPFEEIHRRAREKHIGLDDYWLVRALNYVFEIETLPFMIKKVDIKTLQDFFYDKVQKIMEGIKKE